MKLTFQEIVQNAADEISRLIAQGAAPWMQPLKPGVSVRPVNAATGKQYQGLNYILLCLACKPDPRWVTYRQAIALGTHVRKGEKGHLIFYWRFDYKRAQRDANGKILKDAQGDTVWRHTPTRRPLLRIAWVFNATQLDGLPAAPWETAPRPPAAVAAATDAWVAAHGVRIVEGVQGVPGAYAPSRDTILMMPRQTFVSDAQWYSVLFHELAHWTRHPSRLAREVPGLGHDPQAYAREELRAEIAAWMLCQICGTGFEPQDHAGYIKEWLGLLADDPGEIYRAARDASAIVQFLSPPVA